MSEVPDVSGRKTAETQQLAKHGSGKKLDLEIFWVSVLNLGARETLVTRTCGEFIRIFDPGSEHTRLAEKARNLGDLSMNKLTAE